MKLVYVMHKKSGAVYLRIKAYDGLEDGKIQIKIRSLATGGEVRLDKSSFIKITREENPECFL